MSHNVETFGVLAIPHNTTRPTILARLLPTRVLEYTYVFRVRVLQYCNT